VGGETNGMYPIYESKLSLVEKMKSYKKRQRRPKGIKEAIT
jgi:hypothetical protein